MKNKQKVTIDDLAVMIAKGFKEFSNNLNEFKKEMYVFRDEVYKFKDEMYRFQKDTKAEFKELRNILSVNEYKLQNHEHRLCKIEN